ncbi:MAG TPA: hypothetical protein VN645_04800 [Steroidobacteraceae bacterium]|nr:hypothetical protein [Steroidobacteraceae bacterium]
MKVFRTVSVLAIGLFVTAAALACGDKLSAIGGGVRFERVFAARYPGRIAIYAPEQSALRTANDELRLAEMLRRAGHTVTVFDDPQDLRRALQTATADLVLVDAADAAQFRAAENATTGAPIMSVSYISRAKAAKANLVQSRCVTQLTRRSSALLLRELDTVLERRGRGLPAACESDPFPRAA